MRHSAAEKWEERLDRAMRQVDHVLEGKYGGLYSLHPSRPARGTTAHPSQDGLFSILAVFTLGLGSEIGKGYIVDIKMRTLEEIPSHVRKEIEHTTTILLKKYLPDVFPDAKLEIGKDGPVIKIHGDLSLGTV
jgi:hypothetical protein